MLHIKLKGIEHKHHESKCAVITHTNDPWDGVKGSFLFFSKSGLDDTVGELRVR